MSDTAIRVDGLSKRYRIGLKEQVHDTIGSAVADFVTRPARNLRRLLKLSRFSEDGPEPEDIIWALRDVSFEVARGEIVGLIGRNGAGKTTLLKILSRITDPTRGRIELSGRVSSLLEVGTGFHPELTGRENIYLNGSVLGMRKKEIDRKFDEIVDFSGVETFIDTPVKRYSTGMGVRLAFAVAAHLEAEVLLVDEVLAVGDHEFQMKCLGRMEEVTKQGRTVILVSHNMGSIQKLCPRAILIEDGRIVKDDSARVVVEGYLASAHEAGSGQTWPDPVSAPGNDKVRLHSVRVLSEDGEPARELDMAKEIVIQFSYWCLQEGTRLRSCINVRDRLGHLFLASINAPSASLRADEWFRRPHPVGLYRSECRLTANFLNEGTYSVTPIVAIDDADGSTLADIMVEDAVSFHAYDSGAMSAEYRGSWPGAMRVRLAWKTDFLDSDAPV